MTPETARTLPPGLAEMLKGTDMISTVEDISAMESRPGPSSAQEAEIKAKITPEDFGHVEALTKFFENAQDGRAAASVLEDIDGSRDVCLVSAAAVDDVKRLGMRSLEITPGSVSDWNALTYLHENAHCEDFKEGGYSQSGINVELHGDDKGFKDYYRAYRDGIVSNAEVPYAWRAQRAIDVMENGNHGGEGPEEHSVNAISPLPGERFSGVQHHSNRAAGEAMLQARDDIHVEMGSYIYPTHDYDRLKTINELSDQGSLSLTEDVRQGVKENIYVAGERQGEIVKQAEAQMSPSQLKQYQQTVDSNVRDIQLKIGGDLAIEQPELLYETSRNMLESGRFDNNPAGKKFVENFVDGVERYDPARHGVAPEERLTARPEIVDQLAQQYAPVARPTHNTTIQLQ